MRVITGSARGRRLRELEGLETRPTTGKVKEALFSVIQFDIEGRRVLDKPTAGEVLLSGKSLETIPERDLAAFRRDNLGFVFQEFNLLDTFSIEDNILLPLVLAGKGVQEMQQTLLPLAQSLGIEDILHKFPYEVSGGQKQRAAVARAMIAGPKLLLADEPTGALDSASSADLLRMFEKVNEPLMICMAKGGGACGIPGENIQCADRIRIG